MKFKLIDLFAILPLLSLMLVPAVSAEMMPYSIDGKAILDEKPLAFLQVTVDNLDDWNGKVAVLETNAYGEYQVTLSNQNDIDWTIGQRIQVNFCNSYVKADCEIIKRIGAECHNQGGCPFDINLNDVLLKEVPGETKTEVVIAGEKITIKEVEVIKTSYSWYTGIAVIIGLLAGAGGVWLIKARKTAATIIKKHKKGLYKKKK